MYLTGMNLIEILQDLITECSLDLRNFHQGYPEEYFETLARYTEVYLNVERCYIDKGSVILKKYINEYPDQSDFAIDEFALYLKNLKKIYEPPENPQPFQD